MTTTPRDEAIPLPVAWLDHARCVVEVNTAWVETFGPLATGLVAPAFDTLLAQRDATGRRAYLHALSTVTSGSFSFYAQLDTAGLAYLRFRATAAGWFVLAESVRRGDINATLLFERERWRSVLHGASEGIAILDHEARFVEVNTAFLEQVAPRTPRGALLDEQGIVGWRFSEVVPAALVEILAPVLDAAPRKRSILKRAVVGHAHLEVRLTSTTLPGGGFAGTSLTVHDRTADHRLTEVNAQLAASLAFLEELYRVLPGMLLVFDGTGLIVRVNDLTCTVLGYTADELVGRPTAMLFDAPDALAPAQLLAPGGFKGELTLVSRAGERIPSIVCAAVCGANDSADACPGALSPGQSVVCVALDIRDRRRLEMELRQAQKLESVGRLAAGVAHEINTPIQFVSDSIHFLRDASQELMGVVANLQGVRRSVLDGESAVAAAAESVEAEDAADLPYLIDHMPGAFERCLDGLGRVATIVRSMKEFAHPDSKEATATDINRAIATTLIIAQSEYKFCADVDAVYGELPLVMCHPGDINQALLNIIVNAAHAIGDIVRGTADKGRISVRTRPDGDDVVISISDTGGGIPEGIRERIFDPFFTTKEVGKGTGQGLAISRAVIVDKHGGELSLESELGKGTTFHLRLRVAGARGSEPPIARSA